MNEFLLIKEVIDEWDPINLLSHAPDDEYEPEIRDIVKQLPTVESVDELALVMNEIFVKWFGTALMFAEEYTVKNCYPWALKIWSKIS